MRKVEGRNTKRPETTQHGEDTETQVVSWRHHQEVVFAFRVTWVLTLQKAQKMYLF